ncbi:MAG: SufE family protein [Alphaproteobacteria bacterium]|nr:SufE family protein [Alphaproteobacteria bacterium]
MNTDIKKLQDDFALFDDWEERYRYIIELGSQLTPLQADEYNESNKVQGCVSQAWLICEGNADRLILRGDSDAHIVRGLIAILLMLYSGKSAQTILALNAKDIFQQLGLGEHLTPQRSNGFYAMVDRIRSDTETFLGGCKP